MPMPIQDFFEDRVPSTFCCACSSCFHACLCLLPAPLLINMRTISAKYSISVVQQAEHFTLGLHLLQYSSDSRSFVPAVDHSAEIVTAPMNLHIQMSRQPSSHSTNAQPAFLPSISLEHVRSSTANMTRQDYCRSYLSRDAPFAAFQLSGCEGGGKAGIPTATVTSRDKVDVNPAIRDVSRVFAGAGSSSSRTSRPATINSTHRYPTEIADEDL